MKRINQYSEFINENKAKIRRLSDKEYITSEFNKMMFTDDFRTCNKELGVTIPNTINEFYNAGSPYDFTIHHVFVDKYDNSFEGTLKLLNGDYAGFPERKGDKDDFIFAQTVVAFHISLNPVEHSNRKIECECKLSSFNSIQNTYGTTKTTYLYYFTESNKRGVDTLEDIMDIIKNMVNSIHIKLNLKEEEKHRKNIINKQIIKPMFKQMQNNFKLVSLTKQYPIAESRIKKYLKGKSDLLDTAADMGDMGF